MLVCRPAWQAQVEVLTEAQYHWLAALAAGATLGDALDVALALDSQFDIAGFVQQCLAWQVLQRPNPRLR